jgi:FAD synthase
MSVQPVARSAAARHIPAAVPADGSVAIVEGIVEHGDARGRQLGFPTANLPLHDMQVLDGVWAAVAEAVPGEPLIAAVSIGRRRTFYAGGGERLLEAHLLDFDRDIYGQPLRVALHAKLRTQRSFASVEDLTAQLRRDVRATRAWAAEHYPSFPAPTMPGSRGILP